MQRYSANGVAPDGSPPMWPDEYGNWVEFSKVEAEIRAAVQREREEIITGLQERFYENDKNRQFGRAFGIAEARNFIRSRGEAKPVVLEKLPDYGATMRPLVMKINEIVDFLKDRK